MDQFETTREVKTPLTGEDARELAEAEAERIAKLNEFKPAPEVGDYTEAFNENAYNATKKAEADAVAAVAAPAVRPPMPNTILPALRPIPPLCRLWIPSEWIVPRIIAPRSQPPTAFPTIPEPQNKIPPCWNC